MEYLRDNTPDGAEELLEYFEATYVRGTFRQVQLPAANDDAPAPDARGEPPRKRVKRSSKDLQTRLKAICTQHRDGVKTLEEALRALGHCIRF
ncbi:hypothetical protein ACOMHN_004058 [Nucella lapillus]